MITDDLVRALTASTSIVHASTVHAIVVHNYCLAPKLVLPRGSLGGCDVGWKKHLYYSFKWSCILFLMNSWFCMMDLLPPKFPTKLLLDCYSYTCTACSLLE